MAMLVMNHKIPHYIPVIFHNLSGYDAHLFIKELGKETNELGVIAKNREDYITSSTDVTVDICDIIWRNGKKDVIGLMK